MNELLFGTIEKGKSATWFINLNGSAGNFTLTNNGIFRKNILVEDIDTNNRIAHIKFPLLTSIIPRVKLIASNRTYSWVSKNFFSFYWRWEQQETIIIETIEDIVKRDNSGIITLKTYSEQSNLLIITGIFLSLLRKKRLTLGLYNFYNKNKRDADNTFDLEEMSQAT